MTFRDIRFSTTLDANVPPEKASATKHDGKTLWRKFNQEAVLT